MTSQAERPRPITIVDQGSFAVGGTVLTEPGIAAPEDPARPVAGQTFHGDHAYVFYQVPDNARKLPLVMWHGLEQFSKTWETTPDGREGYQNIFLRRGHSVYLVDQPRRGRAGRSTVPVTLAPRPGELSTFGAFRIGVWPDYFPGVQFSRDPEALNQFFRQQTPSIGTIDSDLNSTVVAELFGKIGPGVLVTHSNSGGMGWRTAIKSANVRGIVSYEPGNGFVFPEGEVPPPMSHHGTTLTAVGVPLAEFMKLTRIPIVIYYGDYIPEVPTASMADMWRMCLDSAKLFTKAVNDRGGDVRLVELPKIGIRGNTHFPFSDLNNIEIADLMSKFLAEKGLDGR